MKKVATSHLPSIGFIALLTFLFFAPVLFTDTTFLPIGSDFINFNFPNDMFAAQSLQRGDFPLWNPYVSSGQPYAADPNIGFLYPLRLLFFPLVFNYQWQMYFLVAHYFLAGVFAYLLAIDMGAGKWGSLAAGMGFMFSGFLVGQMDHINIIYSSIWLPLVFLFFRRSILRKQIGYALLAGLVLSLSILGGHQQISLYIGYWCSIWLLFYLGHTKGRGLLFGALALGLLAVVALLASAIQILPTVEFFQHTERTLLTISDATRYSILPMWWLLLLSPHYLGQTHIEAQPFWDYMVFVNEFYMFVGIIILFSALVGSYVWRAWEKWFVVAMVVLSFFLTAGSVTPIYRLAFQWVPGMQWVRVPSRFVFWTDFALILLAAFGIDWLLTKARESDHPLWRDIYILLGTGVLVGVMYRLVYPLIPVLQVTDSHMFADEINNFRQTDALVFAGMMLGMFVIFKLSAWWKGSIKWMPMMLLLLLLFDLFRAQQPRHFTHKDPLAGFDHPEILAFLQADLSFYRMDFTKAAQEITSNQNWNSLTGFLNGYSQWTGLPWNPFDLQDFADYKRAAGRDSRFYDFGGVKYLVAEENESLPEHWQVRVDSPSSLILYENGRFLPRAFMVYTSLIEPDRDESLELIREEQYDPAETVMLAEGEPFLGKPGQNQVEITGMDNGSLSLEVRTDQPGYLVVSDTYYPGWRVFVNGEEREILRANHAFRAVFLESGQAEVVFQYEPKPVKWGSIISLTTWVLVLAYGGIWGWRKKKVLLAA